MSVDVNAAEERERLACEYVTGLLDDDDLRRCEALLATDTAFVAAVEAWRGRLGELDGTAPLVSPDPALWSRIESSLPAEARPRAPMRAPRPGFAEKLLAGWSSLTLWRGVGLAASAAVLVLAVGATHFARQAAQAPVLVAVMLSDQNRPAAVVNAFRDGRTELVALQALRAPEGKSLQVWTLWDRAHGPVSVGLLDAMSNIALRVEGLPAPAADQLYEVTLEPAGGSPTGRPTGPILMKGNASLTGTGI